MYDRRLMAQLEVFLLSFALVVSLIACKGKASSRPASPASLAENSSANASPAQNHYADVVSRVIPAVVTIRSERRVRAPQQFPFFDDPFFRDFFGDRFRRTPPEPSERIQRGISSGVIVSADGYILTNHHVTVPNSAAAAPV